MKQSCHRWLCPVLNIIEPMIVSNRLSPLLLDDTYQDANAIIKYIIMSNTPSSQCDLPSAIR